MSKIIIKKSTVAGKAPVTTDLDVGELAVNTADAKLYTKHNDGTVKELGMTWASAPSLKNSAGVAGTIAFDGNFLYICKTTGTEGNAEWLRFAGATNW